MKRLTKQKLTATAVVIYGIPVEGIGEGLDRTIGRASRYVRRTYNEMLAHEVSKEIKECGDCKADYVQLGSLWRDMRYPLGGGDKREIGVWQDYCEVHQPIVEKIIRTYNRMRKA